MIKKFLAVSALASAVSVALAPAAQAQDRTPLPGFEPYSRAFVTPLDPEAWKPVPKSVAVSPFGTNDIFCNPWKWSICYQLDPAGSRHDLVRLDGLLPNVWVFNPIPS